MSDANSSVCDDISATVRLGDHIVLENDDAMKMIHVRKGRYVPPDRSPVLAVSTLSSDAHLVNAARSSLHVVVSAMSNK